MMRIGLFLATNMAVLFVIGIILNVLGLNKPGTGIMPMILIAGVMGMAGSFISLLMSKKMAMRSAGAVVIESPSNELETWLVETVHRQADNAEIGHPDVAIFESSAPNAFATGANKDAALVAVSTGLIQAMDRDEVEAVLAHEVSHIANGDMVTMSLLQGVLNTFVFFFARMVAQAVDRGQRGGIGYFATYMLMQMVFGFIASMITASYSRAREYRADAGGASFSSKEKMIAALERLKQGQAGELPNQLAAFGISTGVKKMFSTHPPLDDRIAALRAANDKELAEIGEVDTGTVVRN